MFAALRIAILIFVALLIQPQAWAQTQTNDDIIRSIEVEGNERVEPATIESYLTVKVGDPFNPQATDDSLKNLFATGLFEDASITRSGSALVVRVVENPIINRVAFEGNERFDDEILEGEVQLRPRQVFSRQRVQNAVERIVELYRRAGRFAASVEPQVIELDQNRVDLVFEIEEGPITGVGGITFIGNQAFSDGTLRGVIQTKETAWYRYFSRSDTYDPDRLTFDQELLRRFYRSRGYADMEVVSAIAELTPEGNEFFITFTVEEGERYDFGSITIESKVPDVDDTTLAEQLVAEQGDTYDIEQVNQTLENLTDELGRLGYAFVQVQPAETRNLEARTVDINFVIEEGPRVYVERIDIVGNVRTLDYVIRREFRVAEGDAFNTVLLRESERRIRNLGYFETVELRTSQGSAPDRIVITLRVVEQSTGELSFGAGFSSTDGLLGDIRLSERNLLGRGQDLLLRFTISSRRQEIELSFTEPYLFGRDISGGFDIYRSATDFQSESSFDETTTGITLRAGYPVTEHLRHSVRYTLRQDDIDNVDRNASVFIRDEEGTTVTSLVGQTLTYDRRDSNFLPSEGYIIRVDQDVAGFGGDNRFIRHSGQADYYYPFFPGVVLNLGVNAGYIFGWGGEDVHLANRFFLGGQSFRGFQFGGLGPRDTDSNDSLGGNLFYVGTTELRFPLGLPEELNIFGRVFNQVGTLTKIDVNGPTLEDSGNLRSSAGVGLSWLSPLGPLSIDYAVAYAKESDDQTESFLLSFGARF